MKRLTRPAAYSFTRYLAAKKSVDDRSLNRHVWEHLAAFMLAPKGRKPLKVLEVGCGVGTMVERLLAAGLLLNADYTALDVQAENIAAAQARLEEYAAAHDANLVEARGKLICQTRTQRVVLRLEAIDLFDFAAREHGRANWDLLIAHAVLDLVDLSETLPRLFSLVRPQGAGYFSLNFDGVTILEPTIDPELDRQIVDLYHQTMDTRLVAGKPSGTSLTGRLLLGHLQKVGTAALAAGSSDWVVFPGRGGYPDDEDYFLHFIVNTMHKALQDHPELDQNRFAAWIEERHCQIERRELIYIAHQLDFFGALGSGKPKAHNAPLSREGLSNDSGIHLTLPTL